VCLRALGEQPADRVAVGRFGVVVKTGWALVGDTTGPLCAPLLALDDDSTFELRGLLERADARTASIRR
jgi:hypothetical protein